MRSLIPLCFITILLLSACSSSDKESAPLKGKRISILDLQKELIADTEAVNPSDIKIPPIYKNAFWPQSGGYPSHVMQNLSLNKDQLTKIWSSDIGEGSGRIPLTAQPVVADGKVFTLDTHSKLSAFETQKGKRVWQTNVKDPDEDEYVISGGISFSDGTLYVTSGYDEALALNPENGEVVWRTKLPAPSRTAPTVIQGRVFITLLNNTVLALNAGNGKIIWEHDSISESAGLLGAASPAADRDVVVAGLSSGDIIALRVESGALAWQDNLSRALRLGGISGLADIRALPVLEGDLVVAISYGGKIAAIDKRTGNRIWQREISGSETPWIASNAIYIINADNELMAINKINGAIYWITQLPKFKNNKKHEGAIVWTGPVMAGGRLIVAGTNGKIIEADPKNGKTIRETKIGRKVRIPQLVADNTLYILSEDGVISAYR